MSTKSVKFQESTEDAESSNGNIIDAVNVEKKESDNEESILSVSERDPLHVSNGNSTIVETKHTENSATIVWLRTLIEPCVLQCVNSRALCDYSIAVIHWFADRKAVRDSNAKKKHLQFRWLLIQKQYVIHLFAL